MADFTYASAEARIKVKQLDGTWITGYSARATPIADPVNSTTAANAAGKIVVRVQRKMSAAAPGYGAWAEVISDAGV